MVKKEIRDTKTSNTGKNHLIIYYMKRIFFLFYFFNTLNVCLDTIRQFLVWAFAKKEIIAPCTLIMMGQTSFVCLEYKMVNSLLYSPENSLLTLLTREYSLEKSLSIPLYSLFFPFSLLKCPVKFWGSLHFSNPFIQRFGTSGTC